MSTLDTIWTESELMSKLNLTKQQITDMRMKGLPCLRISQTVRLYNEDDVVIWLERFREEHRRISRVAKIATE